MNNTASRPAFDLSVYLVLGEADLGGRDLCQLVAAAVRGGVTLVQLRDKTASPERFVALGRALKPLLAEAGVPLIVNDRVEEALAIGAAGVHVGQGDMAPAAARARLGPDKLLGLSTHRPAEAAAAPAGIVDYLGVGPLHPTGSKADTEAPIGPAGVAAVRGATALPLVAIGGLTVSRAPAAIAAGADGVAVISAICAAPDPTAAARELRAAVEAAKHAREQRKAALRD